MFINNLAIVFLLFFVNGVLLKKIPEYIKLCKRDQSTINECAREAVEGLRARLIDGIPELEVPGIDPFYIPELKALNGEVVRASGKDIKVTGGGNFTIKSLSVDLDTFTIRARLKFPKMHLEGRYKMDVKVLSLPLKGQGTLYADAIKCDADLILYSQIEEHNGQEYLNFPKLDSDINIKDYRIRLEGLFNGDKTLSEATNEAINQNKGEFLRASKPYLERAVSRILLEAANNIVKDVPLNDLLLN